VKGDAGVALLLVDVINRFDFKRADGLIQAAHAVLPNLEALAASARKAEVPVVYVNDNFGMWQSDFRAITETCLAPERPGRQIVRSLLPQSSDYFVLKPRHSGFFGTPLDALLAHLGVSSLVLAGFATDLCVLFTGLDAHARGYRVAVAVDATAASDPESHARALALFEHTLRAPLVQSAAPDWAQLSQAERRSLF